jgi:CDP-4-dehydro-6-deoxyglucose reductase
MANIELASGPRFASNQSESLLDAAMRSNVQLAYSCKTGRCSTCKCKVLSGQTEALQDELGLSEQEKREGWILGCVRTAVTDVVLDAEDMGGIELPAAKTLPCRVHSIEKLAPDVVKVQLRLPPTSDFRFLPGQYVDVIGQGGIRRSYSLANASAVDKMLELHIREVEGGAMSQYWFKDAKPNDLLRLHGPLGTFFLRESSGADVVFLATGTGIAPIKAMLERISQADTAVRPRSVSVFWGGRTENDLYWAPDAHASLRFVPVLSRASEEWRHARGHVQDVLIGQAPDFADMIVYACGSPAMIQGAKLALIEQGLPERRFYSDAFVCSAAPN